MPPHLLFPLAAAALTTLPPSRSLPLSPLMVEPAEHQLHAASPAISLISRRRRFSINGLLSRPPCLAGTRSCPESPPTPSASSLIPPCLAGNPSACLDGTPHRPASSLTCSPQPSRQFMIWFDTNFFTSKIQFFVAVVTLPAQPQPPPPPHLRHLSRCLTHQLSCRLTQRRAAHLHSRVAALLSFSFLSLFFFSPFSLISLSF